MKTYYAGIGARLAPSHVLSYMREMARELNYCGLILRSGGAQGCDSACEVSHDFDKRDIYLPYDGFMKKYHDPDKGYYLNDHDFTMPIAKRYDEKLNCYRGSTKLFYSRNVSQVFGRSGEPNSSFVLCYTPNGEIIGGTGFALRIAIANNIKIFNYGSYDDPLDLRKELLDYLLTLGDN